MANPGDFAYTVKQQADIVRIVGEYMTLRKSGAQNFQGWRRGCWFGTRPTGAGQIRQSAWRQVFWSLSWHYSCLLPRGALMNGLIDGCKTIVCRSEEHTSELQ